MLHEESDNVSMSRDDGHVQRGQLHRRRVRLQYTAVGHVPAPVAAAGGCCSHLQRIWTAKKKKSLHRDGEGEASVHRRRAIIGEELGNFIFKKET